MADQRLQIMVSPDGLEARARITPGAAADEGSLRSALQEAGVVHGIDDAACAIGSS